MLPPVVVERSPTAPRRAVHIGRTLGLAALALAIVALGAAMWLRSRPDASTAAAASDAADRGATIVGLGKLVPGGGVVTLFGPHGAGDSSVLELHVARGDRVVAGQVLAVMANEPERRAAVASARANLAVREAMLLQTRHALRVGRREAGASLARAKATRSHAQDQLDRLASLQSQGFVAAEELDRQATVRHESMREVERAQATLSRYTERRDEDHPDELVAARNVDAARAELARAEVDLARSTVTAPRGGTILEVYCEAGERPGSAGILDLGDIERMTAEVEVYQTDIGRVRLGAPTLLRAEAFDAPLHGVVSEIGLAVAKQSVIDASPAANTDARVVTVTVALDGASSTAARRYTNLQLRAEIDVGGDP